MELAIKNSDAGPLQVADAVFGVEYKPGLIHQVVTAYMAGARAGTSAQKTRAEVRGGGRKPYRQKGTGRARAGTIRSPLWRGGGVTFAARPRNYEQKVNRKMYRGALRSILSELARAERLIVVDRFAVPAPKTKALVASLSEIGVTDVLILVDVVDDNLALAARNLYGVEVIAASAVDPVSLIAFDHVIVTAPALRIIEERLA